MANITLAGTLRDPNGDLAVGDKVRFTHKSTTGETVKSASSILTIDPTGVYSIDLEYGLILVEYKDARNSQFENLGVATVNGTNPATTIPELLNALVPVSSAELIEFQAILADCVAAKDAAEAAAATLDLINDLSQAYIFDTVALMTASAIAFPAGKVLLTNDYYSGTGGGAEYTVTVGVSPNLGSPALSGGGHARLIIKNNTVQLLQLGSKEDALGDGVEAGTTDDFTVIQYAATLGIKVILSRKSMTSGSIANASKWFGVLDAQISQFVTEPGTKINNLLSNTNTTEIQINKIGFIGNNLGDGGGQAGAIRFLMNGSATEDMRNCVVSDCYFENFIQNYWIYYYNQSSFTMNGCKTHSNTFISKVGNDIDPTSVGIPATCVAHQGNTAGLDATLGKITNIQVTNNIAQCQHIKRFCDVWAQVSKGYIAHNQIIDCGQNALDDTACYGILYYTNREIQQPGDPLLYAMDPSKIDIYNNEIARPRDCGIYVQGGTESNIYSNVIYGQYSTADGTLVKGAIGTNGAHLVNIYSNVMYGNYSDLNLAQINYKPDRDIVLNVYSNYCWSQTGQSVRLLLNSTLGTTTNKATNNFDNNEILGTFLIRVDSNDHNCEVNIKGGTVKNGINNGIDIFTSSIPTPAVDKPIRIVVDGVSISDCPTHGILANNVTYASLSIKNTKLDMHTILGTGLQVAGSTSLDWSNNEFYVSEGVANGVCVNLTGTEYSSQGNTFKGIAAGNKHNGTFSVPTWAAGEGEYVQELRPNEQGAAASKYTLLGYSYQNGGPWLEQRLPTGN